MPTLADGQGFEVGMKLEVVDYLSLCFIRIATVKKILKDGYMYVGKSCGLL